jgi:hypothetical protein
MLLNIVRSRYQEMPVFLEVGSVVTQYAYDRSAGLFAQRESGPAPVPPIDTFGSDINVAFSELPTITYQPLQGEAFATRLYSEVPSDILFAAVQRGWALDVLLRVGLHRLGAAKNMSFGEVRVRRTILSELKKLERFTRAIELLFILTDGEVVEVQQVKGDEEAGTEAEQYLVITDEVPEDLRPALAEFRKLIGIPEGNRFLITTRTTDVGVNEIAIQTRSVMAMIKFMARGIEIPGEHIEDGWAVDYGLQATEGGVAGGLFPFRMRSSRNRPKNVFAAVRHGDYWYYIDHGDLNSKRALEHIMIMFQLRAPPSKSAAPLLTLPTR